MRKKYTDVDRNLMNDIANNLKGILKRKGLSQKELAEMTELSTSAISDYINAKTLMSPGNIHLVSQVLKVDKGEIDPTYRGTMVRETPAQYVVEQEFNPFMIFELVDKYSDDEIIEKFHHQDEDGAIDEQRIRLHLQHVRFLKSQK